MRRRKTFFIAGAIMVMAAVAMTGLYMANREKNEEKQLAEQEKAQNNQVAHQDTEEPAESVTKVIESKQKDTERETENQGTEQIAEATEQESEQSQDVMAEQTPQPSQGRQLHFGADSDLNWPLQGDVILNYNMDQTVYFATLDQYKYNPAVIIAGNVNDRVSSAAPGKIVDISTNEVTGCTVTVDLGDGYSAVYGQLKEVPYQVGDYVENGSTIGFISEPTKYYSVEGSNLYFELQKDGTPVNPVEFFQ